jgi:hypothetical protein
MGMVKVEVVGSFGAAKHFETSAMKGGHVAAIHRALGFLVDQLPNAVQLDTALAKEGSAPPSAPWGCDK